MKTPKTLRDAISFFADPENCRRFMVAVRWADGIVRCPICDSEKIIYLENAKVYYCKAKHPKQKFSLKVGTIFEDSPIGLDKWLPAFWLLSNCKNGVSSYELARALGVTQKSAWFMLHRIREAMKDESQFKFGASGEPVEVDETFVGGRIKNMHRKHVREKYKGQSVQATAAKTAVMGLLDRETRQVRAKVIPNVKRETLQGEILKQVAGAGTVYTDAATAYYDLALNNFVHETVNHLNEYVRGQVHTNGIENFWSLLKRSLNGTYVAVEPFHLDRYVDEQAFRFNNRATKDNPLTDSDRFTLALSQVVNKRLTYAELTGKTEARPF